MLVYVLDTSICTRYKYRYYIQETILYSCALYIKYIKIPAHFRCIPTICNIPTILVYVLYISIPAWFRIQDIYTCTYMPHIWDIS